MDFDWRLSVFLGVTVLTSPLWASSLVQLERSHNILKRRRRLGKGEKGAEEDSGNFVKRGDGAGTNLEL